MESPRLTLTARSLPAFFNRLKEGLKPVWPVVHLLWVDRVCAGANSPAKIDYWTP